MRRKFILGFGLLTLIFVLSGIFVIKGLNTMYFSDRLKDRQQKILNHYSQILYHLRGAEAELYKHQAGYSRNINSLVEHVLQVENALSLTRGEYAAYTAVCHNCHSLGSTGSGKKEILERLHHHEKILDDVYGRIIRYEEKISGIITSRDAELSLSLEREAERNGEEILDAIDNVRNVTEAMAVRMEERQRIIVKSSMYSIMVAIITSIFLSGVIVMVMIRSITKPVYTLVHGIEKVSAGEYNAKVSIESGDEIGFLAKTFNAMTDNLNRVTQQKEMLLGELQDLNRDLERRVREATEELRTTHEKMLRSETLSIVGTFASGVAHELATPLSSVLNYFQMVKDRARYGNECIENINLIEQELRRCKNILGGMLDFTREPEKEQVLTDINGIIRDLLTLVRYQPEYKKSVTIRANLNSDIPRIMAVPGHIRQVFMNIIVNALQSMPEGGELGISTSVTRDGKKVAISISDTGFGISKDAMNKIFQPFFTSKKSGTGLGLSISYGIVRAHGGDIEVMSEYGKGATFIVYFPAPPSDLEHLNPALTEKG